MSTSFNGLSITECFEIASRCGIEINALSELLNGIFEVELTNKNNELPCILVGDNKKLKPEWRMDDSEWVLTDISKSFPLKTAKTNRKVEKYLSYQVSLAGDGILDEPLLHLCLWDDAINFEDCYMGFPLDPNPKFKVIADRLIVWDGDTRNSWKNISWTFSVRLVSLNSEDDLRKWIVEPVLKLLKLNTEDTSLVLPVDFPDSVKFKLAKLTK